MRSLNDLVKPAQFLKPDLKTLEVRFGVFKACDCICAYQFTIFGSHYHLLASTRQILVLEFPPIRHGNKHYFLEELFEIIAKALELGLKVTIKELPNFIKAAIFQSRKHHRASDTNDRYLHDIVLSRIERLTGSRNREILKCSSVRFYRLKQNMRPSDPKFVWTRLQFEDFLVPDLLSLVDFLARFDSEICRPDRQYTRDQRLEVVDEVSPTIATDLARDISWFPENCGKQQTNSSSYGKHSKSSRLVNFRHSFPRSPRMHDVSHFSAESGRARRVGA